MRFAEVILPLPLPGVFTYVLPKGAPENPIGFRAIVPFGQRKIYTGIIRAVKDSQPVKTHYQLREIFEILDTTPVITPAQLSFMEWVSSYYLCALGDVYQAALPSNLKLVSESFVARIPDADVDDYDIHLTIQEKTLLTALTSEEMALDEIRKLLHVQHPYRIIKSLTEKRLVYLYEKVKDKYVPKTETRIRLAPGYLAEAELDLLVERLTSKKKQLEVVEKYLLLVPVLEIPEKNKEGIRKSELLAEGVSNSSLTTLIKNGIMSRFEKKIDRFLMDEPEGSADIPVLSDIQQDVKATIRKEFDTRQVVLLKGITGSGKTEIYINLIQEAVSQGSQVLYLLPEIALTTQIIKRFRKVFGRRFGIYHSRFSDNERAEIYEKCLKGEFDFIIGVRSSVFLPFQRLSLIIVDEEHEPSYKQYDPAPRYHARDSAIYLATIHGASVLLGSATPSLESYWNAREGKYGYVELNERHDSQPLPEIIFADLARARHQRKMKGSFSDQLLEEIDRSIAQNKQVLLFQNRRGYAPFIQCSDCQHIPKCPNCAVSLTYHIYQNQLICHYCGFKQYHDPACTSCGSTAVLTIGTGTEKIEEELSLLMPDLRIRRMDLDTTRNKNAYQQLIDDFEDGQTQVLIGTQMISKGLDFEHVNLVGVFDVDRLIHFPDFRSHERAFQLITQVSGRAGRKHERGRVIIQTSDPSQNLLQHIREGHIELFYQEELRERQQFRYPPYYRMIKAIFRHREKQTAWEAASKFHLMVQQHLGAKRLLGPTEPTVGKIRNYYIYELYIKIEKTGVSLSVIKEYLQSSRDTLVALPAFKSVLVHFDVDPV